MSFLSMLGTTGSPQTLITIPGTVGGLGHLTSQRFAVSEKRGVFVPRMSGLLSYPTLPGFLLSVGFVGPGPAPCFSERPWNAETTLLQAAGCYCDVFSSLLGTESDKSLMCIHYGVSIM